ncbi:MAG TPA: DUF4331 domain-containing protein [Acidimicrobiales bacterium]|nr:DUF4331 domain-containing protein [Acidimicrobiales bacterium]
MAAAGVVTLTLGGLSTLGPDVSGASSHREAPLVAGDPRVDNTDVYAFVSPDKPDTVTLVANWIPFEEPNGGPNFYPFATDARYNVNIDNNGDGKADVAYSWVFADHYRDDAGQFLYNTGPVKKLDDPNLNFYQTYTLTQTVGGESKELVKDAIAAPSLVGPASVPDYGTIRNEAIKQLPDGGQTYVGQADDPFFLDLRVFDLLYGTNLKEAGQDTLSGYNVNTIALQVPKAKLAAKGDAAGNPVIGVWSTTERKGEDVSGGGGAGFKQVSRLGNPLVNEVVVPLKFKDAFNGLTPDKDHTVQPVVDKVLDPIVPKLVEKIYSLPAPAAPRDDLFEIFLTGICKECKAPDGKVALPIDLNSQSMNKDGLKGDDFVPAEELRLNMAIAPTASPNRLGVLAKDLAGFPNGRRLTDDVVDIALQAVEGAAQTGQLVPALAKGDVVDGNDVGFGSSFPYVALPHNDGVNAKNSQSRSASVASVNASAASGAGTESAAPAPSGGVAAGYGGAARDGSLPLLPLSAAVAGMLVAGAGALTMRRRLPRDA